MKCRVCNTPVSAFMSFGPMPIANGFVAPDAIAGDSYRFDLATAVCGGCGMFQLVDQPDPQQMFHDNYAFFSQTSRHMEAHFAQFAAEVIGGHLRGRDDPFVVELGSNDGIMLRHFVAAGMRHLGIEPSANVAMAARKQGVETLCAFFNEDTARQIRAVHGPASAILAANVMCHIGDIGAVARGIAHLLAEDGVLMFEDPYLGDVIEKTSYDQIYDEHVFLFHVGSVAAAFATVGLEVIDARPQKTHGGSMRYVLGRKGRHAIAPAVAAQQAREAALGLGRPETFARFRENCERSRNDLVALLKRLKAAGKRVVGYGATSKSTTVLNYCGVGPDLIEFISDTTPIKQGKLTPGMHIPVKPPEAFAAAKPDYAVLFAWNHEAEILAKETAFVARGGRFIAFVPRVAVLEPAAQMPS